MGRRTVLLLTGEPSGDAAGALLASALRAQEPTVRLVAVGGRRLEAAGCEILEDIAALSAMGFAEVLRLVPRLRRLEGRLRRLLAEDPPDVVVPIDYPGFNLRIARAARARGIPVVYYIGPQVWAWGAGRLPAIRRAVDRMLVVFPFEAEIYRRAGIAVEFVGHPLVDALADAPSREAARAALGVAEAGPVLGLVPGSRPQEVARIFPVMAEAAAAVRRGRRDLTVIASRAGDVPAAEYERALARAGDSVTLSSSPVTTIAAASDVLLVTSGTATLESALAGTPLAVLYRTSAITWFVSKRIVTIPRIALVNIVAGEDLAPEFLQDAARPEAVAAWAEAVLADDAGRASLGARLAGLRAKLGEPGASARAAAAVLREVRA
ncbi:MAG: lipid-A-disaccharide synthase [bacterium]